MAYLFTHHDPAHIHAFFGFLTLLHFAFRITVMLCYGAVFPSWEPLHMSLACMCLHIALHSTSFLLPLPKKRNFNSPMIWPEFRAHNAVFSIRMAVCTIVALIMHSYGFSLGQYTFSDLIGPLLDVARVHTGSEAKGPIMSEEERTQAILTIGHYLIRVGVVILASIVAEWITSAMGDKVKRTTNSMPYPVQASQLDIAHTKIFYRQCQFHASFLAAAATPGFAFLPLYALEAAPFMMTLVRKGLATSRGYHFVYSAALLVPYFAMCGFGPNEMVCWAVCGNLARWLRVRHRWSHPQIWAFVVGAYLMALYPSVHLNATTRAVMIFIGKAGVARTTYQHLHEGKWMLMSAEAANRTSSDSTSAKTAPAAAGEPLSELKLAPSSADKTVSIAEIAGTKEEAEKQEDDAFVRMLVGFGAVLAITSAAHHIAPGVVTAA